MKHKLLSVFVTAALAFCLCFGAAACGGGDEHEHVYTAENKCSVCGKAWEYTETDSYEFTPVRIRNRSGYFVSGYDIRFGYREEAPLDEYGFPIGEYTVVCPAYTQEEIVLPYGYNGLPILSISADFPCSSETVKRVVIPDSVIRIEDGAFYGCTALTSVTIPDSVFWIGNTACAGGALESVTVPNGVTWIGYSAFGTAEVQFKGTVEEWQAIPKGKVGVYYSVTCTDGTIAQDGNVTYFER